MKRFNEGLTILSLMLAVFSIWLIVGQNKVLALGEDQDNPAKSCLDIKNVDPTLPSGLYWIKNGSMTIAKQFYCDMTTAGGGWQLVFQRRAGYNNTDSCGATLNNFLHDGNCGDVTDLAYDKSYISDNINTLYNDFKPNQYMFNQFNSSMSLDADDAYIIHTDANLFPDSPSATVVHDIVVDKICDVDDQNCDDSDTYWKYIGNSWFHSARCKAGNSANNPWFKGNYGYCHNGWNNTNVNSLFGNRSAYNETKLYKHGSASKAYAERVFIRSQPTPPRFDKITVESNNAKNSVFAKAGDDIKITIYLKAADTWRSSYNKPTFSIGSTTNLQTINFLGSSNPKLKGYRNYEVLAGQNGSLAFTDLQFQNRDNLDIEDFVADYIPNPNITVDTTSPTISFADDVSATLTQSDNINIVVSDANPDTASYNFGYSDDNVCNASDNYSESFSSGNDFSLTSPTNNGKYLCVRAEDQAGNLSYQVSANPLNIGQKTVTPTMAPDMIDSSDSGYLNNDNITNETSPEFTINCLPNSELKYYLNDNPVAGTMICPASGVANSLVKLNLLDGDYQLKYTQKRLATGYVESDPSPIINFTIDTVNPTAPVVNVNTDNPYDLDNPLITFSAQDNQSGIYNYQVGLDGVAPTVQTSPYNPSLATAISHTVVVIATDKAGNSSQTTVQYPPVVNINVLDQVSNTSITTTTITVDGPNPIASITASGVSYSNLNCIPAVSAALPQAGPINCTIQINGSGNLTITAVDSVGSTGYSTQDYIIDADDPVISFTDDVEANINSGDQIIIKVTDANPKTDSYYYGFSNDNICDASDIYDQAFASDGQFVINTETHNNQYLCVKAEDLAGNISYQVSANQLQVDVTAPTASFAYSTTAPTNQNVTVTMTTSEPIEDPVDWTKINNTTYSKIIAQNETGSFVIKDSVNNQTTVSYTVNNIDKQLPTISLIGDDPIIVAHNQSFVDPGANCADNNSCTVSNTNNVNTSVIGDYTVTYTATDLAGNTTQTSRVVSVKSDIDGDGIIDENDDDIDGDGIYNQAENNYGTDPSDATSVPRTSFDLSSLISTESQTFAQSIMTVNSGLCNHISQVQPVPINNLIVSEANVNIVAGVEFNLTCANNGEQANIQFELGKYYSNLANLRVYKKSQTGDLADITSRINLTNNHNKTYLAYQITDGQTLDDDQLVNAAIVDPIYIGVVEHEVDSLLLPNTGQRKNFLIVILIMIMMVIIPVFDLGRRKDNYIKG